MSVGQGAGVAADGRRGIEGGQQLCDRHGKPQGNRADQCRKNHDQHAADDKSPRHGDGEILVFAAVAALTSAAPCAENDAARRYR